MTQYPLLDLTHQFQQDVQAVSTDLKTSVAETSRQLLQRVSESFEASPSAPVKQQSDSGAASAKHRLDTPMAEASPFKRSKLAQLAAESITSPCIAREGSWPPKPTRQAELRATTSDETVQMAPRPQASKLGGVAASASAALSGVAASAASAVGLLTASPRQGGSLLDRMRLRGTHGAFGSSPLAAPIAGLVPAANVVAARSRSSNES